MHTNKTQTQVKTKKKKRKKPINHFKTFYVSMAFVGGLAVIIALGMCICRPSKRFVKLMSIDFSSTKTFSDV